MSDARITHDVMESVAIPFVVMTMVHSFAEATDTLGSLDVNDLDGLVDWPEDSRNNYFAKVREDAERVREWASFVLITLDESEDYIKATEELAP